MYTKKIVRVYLPVYNVGGNRLCVMGLVRGVALFEHVPIVSFVGSRQLCDVSCDQLLITSRVSLIGFNLISYNTRVIFMITGCGYKSIKVQ